MYVILSQVLSQWSGLALAVLPTGLSSSTMWCVLEEKETSQNVVTPPSTTVTGLSWLECDVKVYYVRNHNYLEVKIIILQQHVLKGIFVLELEI